MSTATAHLHYCGAGTPLEEARPVVAAFELRHARGEHFWRWTGRMDGGRRVLRCMFCPSHSIGESTPRDGKVWRAAAAPGGTTSR